MAAWAGLACGALVLAVGVVVGRAGAVRAQDGNRLPGMAAADEGSRRVPMAAVTPVAQKSMQSPVQPRHPAAAKAYVVLETYCARCHQAGKASAPGGDLANILSLDEIARVPSLVRPGHPDGSELYHRMFAHPMMGQTNGERPETEPTAPEIETVREWIEDLGTTGGKGALARCAERPFLAAEEQMTAISQWLLRVGEAAARDTRFLSLAHLHNTCATDAELAGYRQAVAKILNGLSWAPDAARVETVGDTLSLLAVRLGDLGWLPAHWEKLVAAYPRGTAETPPDAIRAATGTSVPMLRADWLASAAMRPPLYYDLIGLPPTLDAFGTLVGLELGPRKAVRKPAAASPAAMAARLGVRASAITGTARIIERQTGKGRPVWLAYDVTPPGEGRDPFDQPLGPAAPGTEVTGAFHATGARLMFALPNGLPGFGVYDGDGKRRDTAADVTGTPSAARAGSSARARTPGLGCLGCHDTGVIRTIDEVRPHVEGEKWAGDRDAREAARLRYPQAAQIQKLFDDDGAAFRRAVAQAGTDPDLRVHGLDIVTALARQYDLDVGIERAGAEFGLNTLEFAERLKSFDGPEAGQTLALRLRQSPLKRADAERLYLALRTGKPLPPDVAAGLPGERAAERPLELALWSETPRHREGQLFAVYAEPTADCHLTVISVDPQGRATVLYPNDFDQDNLIRAGRAHRIPARNGAYQLRLKDKGVETLVATCDSRNKTPERIEHDFERQRFTVLGNWRNFLRGVADGVPVTRREAERPARGRRTARGRAGESRAEPRPDSRTDAEHRPDAAARAAIQITVE